MKGERRSLLAARTCQQTGDTVSLWSVAGVDDTGKPYTRAVLRTLHTDGTVEIERTTLARGHEAIARINQIELF